MQHIISIAKLLACLFLVQLVTGPNVHGQQQQLENNILYPKLKKRLKKIDKNDNTLSHELHNNIERVKSDSIYRNTIFGKMGESKEQRFIIEQKFIKDYPNEIISYYLVRKHLGNTTDLDKIDHGLAQLDQRLMENQEVKEYLRQVEEMKNLQEGHLAPDFTSTDTDGQKVSLSDFRGKYVLLDFWASWCGPCRAENPHVVTAFEKFKDSNFTVLGVSLDKESGKEAWLKAIKDDKLTWTNVSDLQFWNSPIAKQYFINAIPKNFLIDPNGVIIARNLRGEALSKKLEEVLLQKSVVNELKDSKEVTETVMAMNDLILKETTAQGALAIYQDILMRYPEDKYQNVGYLFDMSRLYLIPTLIRFDYPQALDYLKDVKSEYLIRPIYESVVGSLVSKGESQKAEQLLLAEIKRTDALRADDKVVSETYYHHLLTYAKFQKNAGRTAEALKNIEELRMADKLPGGQLGFYALLLHDNGQHREAARIFEMLTKEGRTNPEEKKAFKDSWLTFNASEKDFDAYVAQLTTTMKSNISEEITKNMKVYQAEPFELRDMDGKTVSLASLKGKIIFLDFWATWCGPCVGSFPAMKRASELYKNHKDVVFLFVNTFEKSLDYETRKKEVHAFLEKGKYDLHILLDENTGKSYHMSDAYQVKGIPAKYIIDKNGMVQYAFTGFSQGTDDAAVEAIKQMIDSLL
ncbi:TlpA disulfide reductase family protein [Sphingobacterium faecale]|uniref:TlpA family protein disulfide reductase n=1 Tax=Sphingobacterium faecale TaxID=2803775 RepID=A0ABS1R9D0_9SPHI|nr:TlpA disulfide reductase family protein [Sphingobacterium faecale]MBL1410426.1 TlpA family protein disulfide reductase [Sphingobacterium faecale]